MTNVADGVPRPAELARRLGISRQAVQQLLADLQTRGLIELVADPADGPAKIFRSSQRGVQIGEVPVRALELTTSQIEKSLGARILADRNAIGEGERVSDSVGLGGA